MADYYFEINGYQVWTYRYIASISPKLEQMIEKGERIINFNMPVSVMEKILRFLEHSSITLGEEDGKLYVKLEMCAIFLELPELADEIRSQFRNVISGRTLSYIIEDAFTYDRPETREAAFQYFKEHENEITVDQVRTLSSEVVYEMFKYRPLQKPPSTKCNEHTFADRRRLHLQRLFRTQKYTDAFLAAKNGESFPVHRHLLGKFHPFFKNLKHESKLYIPVSKESLMCMLQVIYQIDTDWTIVETSELIETLKFLSKEKMETIQKQVENALKLKIDSSNVVDVMKEILLADLTNTDIKDRCAEVLKELPNLVELFTESVKQHQKDIKYFKNVIHEKNLQIMKLEENLEKEKNTPLFKRIVKYFTRRENKSKK